LGRILVILRSAVNAILARVKGQIIKGRSRLR